MAGRAACGGAALGQCLLQEHLPTVFRQGDTQYLRWRQALAFAFREAPRVVQPSHEIHKLGMRMALGAFTQTDQAGKAVRRLSAERARMQIVETCARMAEAPTLRLPALRRRLLECMARAALPRQDRPPEPRQLVITPRKFPILRGTRAEWKNELRAA
jgi:hypothetical protein